MLAARSLGANLKKPTQPPHAEIRGREAAVSLDLEGGDPEAPEVERMIREVAARTFASMPDLDKVVVRTRSGRFLGSAQRPHPAPGPPSGLDPLLASSPPHPFDLHPHPTEHVEVSFLGDPQVPRHELRQVFQTPERLPRLPLAEMFQLPSSVRSRLRDVDDPVEIVRATLEAGGLTVRVEDDLVLGEDQAIVVVRTGFGDPVPPALLNHAYFRFKESGASRGVLLSPGIMPFLEVRRRELFDPSLLHAGPEGIQRMADAVSLGGNPMHFAAAPAVTP